MNTWHVQYGKYNSIYLLQNANAKVSPPLSELQVLNEQLFQTLAEYISSMSVLMFMNFQYVLKLTLVVGHFS